MISIKQFPFPWFSSTRDSKREEVILTRLRIGHTRVTHSYLLDRFILFLPSCPHCHKEVLTVSHFFSCPYLHSLRSSLLVPPSPLLSVRQRPRSLHGMIAGFLRAGSHILLSGSQNNLRRENLQRVIVQDNILQHFR